VALTATTAYTQLVTATSNIATAGGIVNGFAISPQCKAMLLSAVDGQNRPLFINSVAEGAIPQILGAPTIQSKGMYKAKADSTPAVVGIVGDWTQAVYGTVEGVQIAVSDQATLTTGSTTINLWQNNMVAVRAEIEIGFRADTSCFNLLTIA
jgi:HK97 family phage major capsid protein